ncbi:MAG: cyclic nucleotide-binding domain-containing protein [Proteobacteria bacterium]|nr:cyclic nucleotide-binding domain-containing protein [Pseudomonadota bacterium]MCP4918694.1 cyclic nucleotide-binding domain-containing protein [Pseudomonadota bacterium]
MLRARPGPDRGPQTSKKSDLKAVDQLAHEARLMAYLDHPGVVPVFPLDEDGAPSYTMKELRGETLHAHLKRRLQTDKWPSVYEAVQLFTRISEAMANAHEKGILHLDLKPANIMVEPHGHIVVIDWGLSRFYHWGPYEAYLERGQESSAMAKLREPDWDRSGPPPYMSVEQMTQPFDRLGPPADIFSAGVVLYVMLTKRRPFPSQKTSADYVESRRSHRVVPPHRLRADVPRGLSDLCVRMLLPGPSERPQTFREVLDELGELSTFGASGQVRGLAPGEVLFHEGDDSRSAYQILDGTLDVSIATDAGPKVLATRSVGDIIGELAMLSGTPRSATLTATSAVLLREVTPEVIEAELDKVHPLLARMVRRMSDRLIEEVDKERQQ